MQKIIISGTLGKDTEVKDHNGRNVMIFSVAVDASYVKDGAKVDKANWFKVVKWSDKEQKLAQYLLKGTKVNVIGTPSIETYINAQTGVSVGTIVINFPEIELMGGTKREGISTPAQTVSGNLMPETQENDLPF